MLYQKRRYSCEMKVLVAEDDATSRRILRTMLTKWGYEVVEASDGVEALQVLQEEDAPRLAILDWMMPGMDGVQVCREIRRRGQEPYIYILLLTARNRKEDLIEGMDAGLDDYITKPFDMQELRVRLRAGRRILDLQSQLLSMRQAFQQQATHDPLTGLPNRLLFSDRLTRKLAEARRNKQSLAVMFMDLDRFKEVNDRFGHSTGDSLLCKVAERLRTSLRDADTVARMGGDEFTVILGDISSTRDVSATAQRVFDALLKPFDLPDVDQEVEITASIGISIYPVGGADVETLVRNADLAMYKAKEQGRNRFSIFTKPQDGGPNSNINLAADLQNALDRGQFVVYYQPRLQLATGRIVGAEALVRWQHPELGLLAPGDFIQIAEETGAILTISQWTMERACAQNKAWQKTKLAGIETSINVSAVQFRHEEFLCDVKSVLKATGVPAKHLMLEIRDNIVCAAQLEMNNTLKRLKEMGLKVCIDNFGTEDGFLRMLQALPVDAVKIDRSLICNATATNEDAEIVRQILDLAHDSNLRVVAEGVETLDQLEFLRSIDCDEIQGYFVSQPVPATEFEEILSTVPHFESDSTTIADRLNTSE